MSTKYNRWLRAALPTALSLTLWACSEKDDPAGPGSNTDPDPGPADIAVVVDPDLDPDESMPGQPDRPIAVVVDASGAPAEFVANELWISSPSDPTVEAFVERWDGEVVGKIDPDEIGLDVPKQFLVRVDVTEADLDRLVADLRELNPDAAGSYRVSSLEGLGLLAAGAAETAAGLDVGVNWIGRPTEFRDRSTEEAPTGGGSSYDPNAFTWTTHSSGSTQDIGVAEAWRALELSGRLDNRVGLAILDMGFSDTGDLRRPFTAISNVPFIFDPMDVENLSNCGGPCPWHGTNVASTAMAMPDDGFGGAGPGGPVAQPILVFTSYDYFTSIFALTEARLAGARIANMSYSARVPALLSWTVLPFNLATLALRESGMLMFAAAGNDGQNVDEEDCFLVCWEEAWHTPCENGGVICVGGLGRDSKNRASGSNFGNEEVDIFAPFTMFAGPDPDNPGNIVQSKNGTSFSSPFVAGVAALIWAADPSLSADEVEDILMRTAHLSPDPRVRRYVNAHDAVREALGDSPPFLRITSPGEGDSFSAGGAAVSFAADAEDLEDGTPTVIWTSDRDGEIGRGTFISRTDLSMGSHLITARAVDSAGGSSQAQVRITIVNNPPTVEITTPDEGDTFVYSQLIQLRGTSFDLNSLESLPESGVSWYIDGGSRFAVGHLATIPARSLSVGTHRIRFVGTDGTSQGSDEVTIRINDDPIDLPPSARITAPGNGSSFWADESDPADGRWYKVVDLRSVVSDPEDGDVPGANIRWTTSIDGAPRIDLATGRAPRVRLYANQPFASVHRIRLTVIDSAGNETTDEIEVTIQVLS